MNLTGQPTHQKTKTLRYTPDEWRYYAFLAQLPCCLTGRTDSLDIAHTGGLAEGKGTGRKSMLWTCLPLLRVLHIEEERNRKAFWVSAGFPDHLAWADRLYDAAPDLGVAEMIITEMNMLADRAYLAGIMMKGEW